MTCKGTVKGKTIELEETLPPLEGKKITVNLEAIEDLPLGSSALLLKAMHEPPHLEPGDIEELNRILEESKIPVRAGGFFDDEDSPE